ncbi:hypothetical protein [Niallia endozanthoxylica]|uniref:Uncharacterized protein n=1 Tax=Niallia endozanthoxylica TaxID=2036016 RepID=A0A5J5GZX1_9BACI|nr:hypothetical protein [Niallia endozanthoxylica]KAA9013810.1 hypothetical protein F4V44_24400 [Niallia endozanthoxylica]
MSETYYRQFLHIISRDTDQPGKIERLNKDEISKLVTFIKSLDYNESNNLVSLASFLHYGQMTGGEQFIDAFDVEQAWKLEVVSQLTEKLHSLSSHTGRAYERDKEREWRLQTYQELTNPVKGFDAYFTYQPSMLLFETERFLHELICYMLDSIALIDPKTFTNLCQKEQNPLWSLRWVQRLDNFTSDIILNKEVFEGLPIGHQGILSAYLWDQCLMKKEKECRETTNKLLLFHMQLPRSFFLSMVARILSNITNNHFSTLNHIEKIKKSERQLETLLTLAAKQFVNLPLLTEAEVNQFVDNFYNPVNQEVIWACLTLVKKVENDCTYEYPIKNTRKIRQTIINSYPSYWKTKGNHTRYSFSEDLTINLVEELAIAINACYQEQSFDLLDQFKDIPDLFDLFYLRDAHEYGQLIESKRLLLVHAYLACQLLTIRGEQKEIPKEKWDGFFDFVLHFTELDSKEHSPMDQKIRTAVFTATGSLFAVYGYPDTFNKWLRLIHDPFDYLAIIKSGIELEKKDEIFALIENRFPLYVQLLRSKDLLELGYEIYSEKNFTLAAKILSHIQIKSFNADQMSYWKRLTSTAYLNAAFESKNISTQIQNLKAALQFSRQKVDHSYNPYMKENQAVTVQIIGWLFDRNEASYSELLNAYNLIALQPWKIESGALHSEDYYVSSLILVRLLSASEKPEPYHLEQMEVAIERMSDLPGHQLTQELLRSWYALFTGKDMERTMIMMEQEKIKASKQWLPRALQTFFEEIINGDI